jgi:hypothetical protein
MCYVVLNGWYACNPTSSQQHRLVLLSGLSPLGCSCLSLWYQRVMEFKIFPLIWTLHIFETTRHCAHITYRDVLPVSHIPPPERHARLTAISHHYWSQLDEPHFLLKLLSLLTRFPFALSSLSQRFYDARDKKKSQTSGGTLPQCFTLAPRPIKCCLNCVAPPPSLNNSNSFM